MTLSTHAAAAKAIRQHLKANGIDARVKSNSFAGGNSVDVRITDPLPKEKSMVEEYVAQYRYGSYDPYQGFYVSTNRRSDIPQVKYTSVDAVYSIPLRQEAWDYIRANFDGFSDAPDDPDKACSVAVLSGPPGANGEAVLYRVLSGSWNCSFWSTRKPHVAA